MDFFYSHKGQGNAKYGVLQIPYLMKKNVPVNVPWKIHVSFLESLNLNSVSAHVQIKKYAIFQSFLTRQLVIVTVGLSFAENHKSRILTTANVNVLPMQSVHHTKFWMHNASVNVLVIKNVLLNIILIIISVNVNAEELTTVMTINILIWTVVNVNVKVFFLAPMADIITQGHVNVSAQIHAIQILNICKAPVNVYLIQT